MKSRIVLAALAAAVLASAACAPGKSVKSTPAASEKVENVTTLPGGTIPAVPGLNGEKLDEAAIPEANIRGGEFVSDPGLENVYFEFDKYSVSDAARATLEKNAAALKSRKDKDVLVEGHCDERGTIEYNIALGQKRAKEIREYYMRLGIPGDTITTISYGKEKPACQDHAEECWSRNRRAETKLRLRAAAATVAKQ
ncbi:MAG: peptidoglycan-associated lipoprotein Pal [Elusimicrobiales bacterium]|nr:peptidoglycan-associated lipoprotein Pal [Elusimicrobiales bacterium]